VKEWRVLRLERPFKAIGPLMAEEQKWKLIISILPKRPFPTSSTSYLEL
jgi:hypothetical protein